MTSHKAILKLDPEERADYEQTFPKATDNQLRCVIVLEHLFKGLHHCRNIKFDGDMVATNKYGDLSTFDSDDLTRLVRLCHAYCVRATICSSGPQMVKIKLWARHCVVGAIHERHPEVVEPWLAPEWEVPPTNAATYKPSNE